MSSTADMLRQLRESTGLNQKDFAASVGMKQTTYNGYETGKHRPKSDVLIAIANKYNVSVDYLLGISCDDSHITKKVPSTTEAAPETELEREVIRLAGNLSDEQKDFFLALLRLTAARNQGLSAADLVSAGEAALKAEHHNPTQ